MTAAHTDNGRSITTRCDLTQRRQPRRARVITSFAVVAMVLAGAACSGDDDPTTDVKVVDLGEEQVGDCLLVGEEIDAQVSSLPVIDCAEPHSHEIFATLNMDDDPEDFPVYPGTEALEAVAERECLTAFEDYVGISPFDSELFYSWLVPTLDSWTKFDDRIVLCVASTLDNSLLPPGSIEGSKR